MSDLISRADAIEAVARFRNIDGVSVWHNGIKESLRVAIIAELSALPSAVCDDCIWHVCNYNKVDWDADVADSDGLIIKGAKGVKDGLYNIKDGKLFQYKAKGGTVRVYEIVPSADAVQGEWVKVIDKETPNVTMWHYECDQCGQPHERSNYCPNCGARMTPCKGGDDE